jgi:ABC-type Fe3+-hydroxamate transport system substrate-binding protein
MLLMKMGEVFVDMMGREVVVNYPPLRIVSLVPSQTELLYDLGLKEEVVGITKFCVHPDSWYREKTRVGGTKNVNMQRIAALQPDLIIANKEENTREQIEELAKLYPVWISDICDLNGAMDMINGVGRVTARIEQSIKMVDSILLNFNDLNKEYSSKRVVYFIWKNPWMCAGGDTFISNIITRLGWINVFEDIKRYPEVTLAALKETGAELILLSSEPYPFKQQHIDEIMQVMPQAQVMLVDGEMFSWYGSRLLHATGYFKSLLEQLNH